MSADPRRTPSAPGPAVAESTAAEPTAAERVCGPIGVVVIGRNEGERLRRCLRTLAASRGPTIYVDSASSDGSAEAAAELGVPVIRLDVSAPLSAARARNEGFAWMQRAFPHIRFVQFVDGDCEISAGWLDAAFDALASDPGVAIVCGRVRERFPERSVYNRLCDIEFARRSGEVMACGGIFMASVVAFGGVGGFNPAVIAGEEPELCFRLRAAGYKIMRLDTPMAMHDSGMTKFRQWWRRSVRGGIAYAQGFALHGQSRERFCRSNLRGIAIWIAIPALSIAAAWPSAGLSLLLLLGIPVQIARIAWKYTGTTGRRSDRWLYAAACMAAKPAQAWGVVRFALLRARGRAPSIVEYKGSMHADRAETASSTF